MRVIYECGVCRRQFNLKENCISCEEKHKQEVIFRRIELIEFGNDYGWHEHELRFSRDVSPSTEVKCYGLFSGYPNFSTECLDTKEEVFLAKKRLIAAARNWVEKYSEMLNTLNDETDEKYNEEEGL